MREIKFEDVRPGDVARSNGKEMTVVENGGGTIGLRLDSTDYGLDRFTANALGVSFWREERRLPDYPGANVSCRHKAAVREAREIINPWFTNDHTGDTWKSDDELHAWLGPDWVEKTTPPVRLVPVEPAEIAVGDYVRAELDGRAEIDGLVLEGRVSVIVGGGRTPESIKLADYLFLTPGIYTWFKREGGESDE